MIRTLLLTMLMLVAGLGPVQADTEQAVLAGLHQVLVTDSARAVKNLAELKSAIETDAPLQQVQTGFRQFATSWKRVETLYLAGALDEEYVDHPRFIDYFHQGNESIPQLVQRALDSGQPLANALFKNSTRGINALEYLLFSPDQALTDRQREAALIAIGHIELWLGEIADFYNADRKFLQGGKKSLGLIVNRLVDSSYKLHVWRIGEAGGLIKKYQGNPSAQRLEFHLSAASLDSVIAILQTHRSVFDNPQAADLGDLGQEKEAATEVGFVLNLIDQALATAQSMQPPLSARITDPDYQNLFRQLGKLHKAYYFMLIDALQLSSHIIDADGD